VGDGSKAARFREMCRDLGDRVVFTGWLDNYDTLIDECRFVIGASGHGGVTFDTIPYGVPVIVSKYDPVEGFWKHGENCLVFDPDDEEDYRRNILAAVADRESRSRLGQGAVGFRRRMEETPEEVIRGADPGKTPSPPAPDAYRESSSFKDRGDPNTQPASISLECRALRSPRPEQPD
jgi:glycosyltransferase involved in cell wall biosynthesis